MSNIKPRGPASLIHRLNLDVVGGAEVSFAQYAGYRRMLNVRDTVIVGDQIHPRFAQSVSSPLTTVARREFRRWHGLRLPRFARRLRARIAVSQSVRGDEAALVGWNTIGNREIAAIAQNARLPLVHYEHGQAWRAEVRHARDYFAQVRGVVSNSEAAERILALRWGWSGQTQRVYCTVDSVRSSDAVRTDVPRNRCLQLGLVGRMVEVKGHRIALHMLKVLRDRHAIDARLLFAGTGECESVLRSETRRLGLRDAVCFQGSVNDMPAFYDAIDVLIAPSLREPFGRTSIEAQARGCPVVATAVDGLPETLPAQVHETALVTPTWPLSTYARELGGAKDIGVPWVYSPQRDELVRPLAPEPDRFAAAVAALVQNDQAYHRASRAGLEHVDAGFSGGSYGPAVDSAIMALISKPDRSVSP